MSRCYANAPNGKEYGSLNRVHADETRSCRANKTKTALMLQGSVFLWTELLSQRASKGATLSIITVQACISIEIRD